MNNKFADQVHGMQDIPSAAAVITPSDAADLPHAARRIHVGGAGDLDVTLIDGTRVTFSALGAGAEKTGLFTKVWAANTTATLLIAEW
jgi:hypothetical protein